MSQSIAWDLAVLVDEGVALLSDSGPGSQLQGDQFSVLARAEAGEEAGEEPRSPV